MVSGESRAARCESALLQEVRPSARCESAWLRHAETHGEGVYVLQALAVEARTADCHDVATHVDGLVRRARAHVGCLDDSTTLVSDEFKVALEYLQQEFENNFMHNSDLAQRIRDFKEHPERLSRTEKDKVRSHRHGAFKSWQRRLLGDNDLLHHTLRHGIFTVWRDVP